MKSKETLYRLICDGTRVRRTKAKQHPIRLTDPEWLQEIHRKANDDISFVRVKDGHRLWGCTDADVEEIK